MFKYIIHGFKVESAIKLNCYDGFFDSPDVTIGYDNKLEDFVADRFLIDVNEKRIKMNFIGVGIYEIIAGNEIKVSVIKNVDTEAVEAYLLAQVFAALMIQRGVFPLHGATVSKNDIGIMIVGDPGSGKTTLSTALMKNGWKMVTDDIITVSLTRDKVTVSPSFPFQKIWKETAEKLKVNLDNSRSLHDRKDKFYFEDKNYFSNKDTTVNYLIEISEGKAQEVVLNKLKKSDLLSIMIKNSYGYRITYKSNQLKDHMKFFGKLSLKINGLTMERPKNAFSVNEQLLKIKEMVGFL